MRRHEVPDRVDGAQQFRRVDGHLDIRRGGRVVGGSLADQIRAAARRRRVQRIAPVEERQLVAHARHHRTVQIGRSGHPAGHAARQHRLRGTAVPGRVEHVRAIGGPRQPDAQCGCQRGEDVDGLDIGIHGLALPLARAFEEQWHCRDVDERGLGRLEEREAGPQARAVVRGDDDQRIVVHPRIAQLRHQRADNRIDVLQLQQVPLIANRGGPLVVQPALVAEADVAALQREPLARPEQHPRMMREQHVQEIERRSIAGRVARVWTRREEPLGKRGARGEVAPALGDGRQPCGEIVGQDHGQIDHREVGGARRGGQSAAGHSSVSGSCTCRR